MILQYLVTLQASKKRVVFLQIHCIMQRLHYRSGRITPKKSNNLIRSFHLKISPQVTRRVISEHIEKQSAKWRTTVLYFRYIYEINSWKKVKVCDTRCLFFCWIACVNYLNFFCKRNNAKIIFLIIFYVSSLLFFLYQTLQNFTKERIYKYIRTYFAYNYICLYMFIYIFIFTYLYIFIFFYKNFCWVYIKFCSLINIV